MTENTKPDLPALIAVAVLTLRPEDQKLIDPTKARSVFELVLQKRARTGYKRPGPLLAVRTSMKERHIGDGPQSRERRQKIFTAYWRLLTKVLALHERLAAATVEAA